MDAEECRAMRLAFFGQDAIHGKASPATFANHLLADPLATRRSMRELYAFNPLTTLGWQPCLRLSRHSCIDLKEVGFILPAHIIVR